MTANSIQVPTSSGPRLATNSYIELAVTVHDEKFIPGEYPYPSYSVFGGGAISTANSHQLQIMAGASLNVRIRRIRIYQTVVATTLSFFQFELWRLSTAGTGGTAVTPAKMNTAAAASGATAMTLATSKGTESVQLDSMVVTVVSAATAGTGLLWEWTQLPNMEPIIIAAGTTNGIAVKSVSTLAAGSVRAVVEFVETAFV